jgi:Orsellinic acid/F9775 biosynthesis cluster protein D
MVETRDIVGNSNDSVPTETATNTTIPLPLALDSVYNIAVCTDCSIGVPFDWIEAHLKDNHGLRVTQRDIVEHLDISGPTMTSAEVENWTSGNWILAKPVEHVPVDNGSACNICQYSVKAKKSMKNHFTESHRGVKRSENVTKCKVQTPFKGILEKYIQIEGEQDIPMDIDDDDNDWRRALRAEMEESRREADTSEVNEHDNIRLMGAFIAKIRWDLVVKDRDMKQLQRLIAVPTKTDELYKILLCGRRYIEKCCNALNGGNMMMRRLLMVSRYVSIIKIH